MLGRIWSWFWAMVGSRSAIAVFALLFVAFASHAISSPQRLPPIPLDALAFQFALPIDAAAEQRPDPCAALGPQHQDACRGALASGAAAAQPLLRERITLAGDVLAESVAADPGFGRGLNAGLAAVFFLWMLLAIGLYARRTADGHTRGDHTALSTL